MNDSSGKIMTQTKKEALESSNCETKSDDRAREVSESRMSAKVAICGTNDECTRMNNIDVAKYEREVNDKATRVSSQESEGYRELVS